MELISSFMLLLYSRFITLFLCPITTWITVLKIGTHFILFSLPPCRSKFYGGWRKRMIGEVDLFAYSLRQRHGKYMGEVTTFFLNLYFRSRELDQLWHSIITALHMVPFLHFFVYLFMTVWILPNPAFFLPFY